MSRRHRVPVLAFVAMAVVCTVVLAYSIRGSAADGVPRAAPGLGITSPGQTLVLEDPSVDGPPADVEDETAALSRAQGAVACDKVARAKQRDKDDKSDRPGRGLGRTPETHPGKGHGLDKAHPGKGHAKGKARGKAKGHARAGHGKAKGHSKVKGHGRGKGRRWR